MPSAFFTDRYTLTMGQMFFKQRANDRVSFELFVRRLPADRGYMVTAGLGTALWWLEHLEFGEKEWQWMLDQGYDPDYAGWLYAKAVASPRFFTGDIDAIPEGTPIGAETPILRVTAPRIEATLVESVLLSAVNHQIMVASKAARIIQAAKGRGVWDFSLRRLHGPEAGIGVARAAYIAGCEGTATVEAGRLLGIPTTGTMAHHYLMAGGPENEQAMFTDFIREFPDQHAMLVDTWDTQRGVWRAIRAAQEVGVPLQAIRLDSGNLQQHAAQARAKLREAGTPDTTIIASNDLDEYSIADLDRSDIDVFGVGTMLGTVPDAPNVGGVYKLVEQHERQPQYVMKTSKDKATDPGCHQVWHTDGGNLLALVNEDHEGIPLLTPVMRGGRSLPQPTLAYSRQMCRALVSDLSREIRRVKNASCIPLRRSTKLIDLRRSLGDTSV